MVVASIRCAKRRSASGGIASSLLATAYQQGRAFQAGVPITSPSADADKGCCTAYITLASTGSTSAAKWFTKSSCGSHAKPWSSIRRWASAGVGSPWARSPPIDSPSSSPNAAM